MLKTLVRYKGALPVSSGPSFLCRNRLGVYCYMRRIPSHFRRSHPALPPFIRKSLLTRNRRKALRLARKLSVIFDELAQQYFGSPEEFAAAIKLLQRYEAAERQCTRGE